MKKLYRVFDRDITDPEIVEYIVHTKKNNYAELERIGSKIIVCISTPNSYYGKTKIEAIEKRLQQLKVMKEGCERKLEKLDSRIGKCTLLLSKEQKTKE